MKPRTLQQIEEMKKQTIGVEMEFTGITRDRAAKVVADFFNTTAYYEGGTYYKWDIRDQQGRKWQIMYDSSIEGYPRDFKCELVTPILKYEDIEDLQEIARRLRKAGAKSNAEYRCGVHIHIGADGHTPQSLRNLANIMASREQLIGKAIRIGANRMNDYCQVTDQAFLNRLNTKKPKTKEALEKVWYDGNTGYHSHYDDTRYHMLNLHATFTKGTVEFRLFNFGRPENGKQNGIHAGELKAWIQLCLAMSQQAKMVRDRKSVV